MLMHAGEQLLLQWHGEGEHAGHIPLEFLLNSTYSDVKIKEMSEDKTPTIHKVRLVRCTYTPR
jgi:hypothetical protein